LGAATLLRGCPTRFNFAVTNEDSTSVEGVRVTPVLESYVGQATPLLFARLAPKTIKNIAPKETAKLSFRVHPIFPGVVAVAVSLTDKNGVAIRAKRATEETFQAQPVRWWFHVLDDISVETLDALNKLLALQTKKEQ
jgi:hypothetical protein